MSRDQQKPSSDFKQNINVTEWKTLMREAPPPRQILSASTISLSERETCSSPIV